MNWHRRAWMSTLLAGLLLALPSSASAATPITVDVELGWSCLSGTGPASKEVQVALKTADGQFRERLFSRSDATGYWDGCFNFDTTYINGGDRLRVIVGAQERVIVVPQMTPTIERVGDKISGHAPAGAPVEIRVLPMEGFTEAGIDVTFQTVAGPKGRYEVDTTSRVNLRGRDQVTVYVRPGNDGFWTSRYVPYLQIGNGQNRVTGFANPGTNVELVLTDSQGNYKGGNAGLIVDRGFTRDLYADDGSPAYPLAGDWLLGNWASDGRLRLPQSELEGWPGQDVVTGRCMANARYSLNVDFAAYFSGKTSSDGRFSKYVGRRHDLKRGQTLSLQCLYPSGDVWQRAAGVG